MRRSFRSTLGTPPQQMAGAGSTPEDGVRPASLTLATLGQQCQGTFRVDHAAPLLTEPTPGSNLPFMLATTRLMTLALTSALALSACGSTSIKDGVVVNGGEAAGG